MTEILLRMLCGATLGLALVLLLRRPARRLFGAGPAFSLWLLPAALMAAPLLPHGWLPSAIVVLPAVTVTPHLPIVAASPRISIDWPNALVALWALGAAIGLLQLGLHYGRLLRNLRAAPGTWAAMLAVAAPTLDIRRVRTHDAGPAVLWALPRSLVLLPLDFADRFDTEATRELVLRHELTHMHRGDALWSFAMEVASALLWFHPLAWLARARFRLDQEMACDAASLRASPERTANYARALLDSVAVRPAPALIPWLSQPQLKERIAMITRIPPGALRRRAGFVTVAVLLAGGLYVAGGPASTAAATQTGSKTAPSVDITYKNRNPPHYPAEAVHKGEQGEVLLVISVDAAGKVLGVSVDPKRTTAPAILQTAAVQAANKWRFNPGMKMGHAVGGKITVPVTFSLDPSRTSAHAQTCPPGFNYKKGTGKSYSCIAPSPVQASS